MKKWFTLIILAASSLCFSEERFIDEHLSSLNYLKNLNFKLEEVHKEICALKAQERDYQSKILLLMQSLNEVIEEYKPVYNKN